MPILDLSPQRAVIAYSNVLPGNEAGVGQLIGWKQIFWQREMARSGSSGHLVVYI